MKHWSLALAISVLVVLILGTLFYLAGHVGPRPSTVEVERAGRPSPEGARIDRLQTAIDDLETRTEALSSRPTPIVTSAAGAVESGASNGELVERFQAVENEIKELRKTLENLVPATEVITEKFAEPTGFTHADAYFDDGKYATAAGGYLTFLESHPNHPDALDFMRKAREAYFKAGYRALAIDVQKKILDEYELDNRYAEIMRLASLEKEVKRYDDAMAHAGQAMGAATTPFEKLTALSYRSWYTELGQGAAAGLGAYQDAERVAESMGLSDTRAAERIRTKIDQLQKIVDAAAAER